ncbi:MAG: hypothetical protein AUI14_16995 [Actinobacteria bacterium 13_2_20CM_2_71_6]|nr:MAG: hypothetical protein AUI14_16995 [Actinobacteria bacterium 13_2_20CM_2_71_6]
MARSARVSEYNNWPCCRETGIYMALSLAGETSFMKLRPVSLLNTKYGSTPSAGRQSPRAARCNASSS